MANFAQAASLSPTLLEIDGSRGEVIDQTIQIINTQETEQMYFTGVLKFESSSDSSTPSFIPYDEDHSGLPEWIHFPVSEIRVPARTRVDLPVQIVIPSDVNSGGYYAAITVSNAPSDVVATNGAIIEAKTAVLVLLTVSGDTRYKAGLLDFTSEQFGEVNTSIAGTYEYRIQNQGNVHIQPKGTIRFTDVFGRNLLEVDANEAIGRVLPGTTRTYSVEVPESKIMAFGPVNVELDIDYGGTERLSENRTMWLWKPLVVVSVLLIICLVIVVYKRIRRTK